MKNRYLVFGLFLMSLSAVGQRSINTYKNVIVADKFDFLKKVDGYQTSSLTKFLLNKYDFVAYLNTDILPKYFQTNRCENLFVKVQGEPGMFTTKVVVEFRDCNGVLVYKSKEGRSKKKEYKTAYHEAIRKAFLDTAIVNHKYVPLKSKAVIVDKKQPAIIAKPIIVKPTIQDKKAKITEINILYAQANKTGFQLVDTSPKIVFTLLKTASKDLFILKDKNGILYKIQDNWIAEYYVGNKKLQQQYSIKF